MRYRPFGNAGTAVSALSLLLREDGLAGRRPDWRALVLAALENGINAFEIAGTDARMLGAIGEALAQVERRLVFAAWRLEMPQDAPLTAEGLSSQVREVLEHTGLGHIDLIMLHEPAQAMAPEALSLLRDLRQARLTRLLGVCGDGQVVDHYLASGVFQALAVPYNLTSGWQSRNRLKAAAARDMAVIGREACPPSLREGKAEPLGKRRLFGPKAHPLKGVGGFRFLYDTPGWTAEEICVAYALTEPSITTVQVEPGGAEPLARLAGATERDLPAGVAAQIEMARFSAARAGAA